MRSNQHFSYTDFTQDEHLSRPIELSPSSNYIYMIVFAVEYTYALFNVFAGPVFSNIIAGELLDCIIWGVSPVIFWFIQEPLRRFIVRGTNPYRRRLYLLIGLTCCKIIAYSFLCYNEKFKWNYFTKVFNLDFGYVLLDLSCKSIYFVFMEQQDQEASLTSQVDDAKGYYLIGLKFSFIGHITCYVVAFYFAFLFSEEHQKTLQSCCMLAALVSIPIPIFYYYRNEQLIKRPVEETPIHLINQRTRRNNLSYMDLNEGQQQSNHLQLQLQEGVEGDGQIQKQSIITSRRLKGTLQLAALFFMQSSLTVNLSYSTFWIMDGLMRSSVRQNVAFTTSIMYGSMFFCISTFIYLLSGYALHYLGRWVKLVVWCFNLFYAALLIECYIGFSVGSVCIIILLTGMQLALVNAYEDIIEQPNKNPNTTILAEFFVYCVVPVAVQLGMQLQEVRIYMMVSGLSCLLSTVCSLLR